MHTQPDFDWENELDNAWGRSYELMNSEITYPKRYRYRGSSHNHVGLQWGGITNIVDGGSYYLDANLTKYSIPAMTNYNYIALRSATTSTLPPVENPMVWDAATDMFELWHLTDQIQYIYTLEATNHFDLYMNNGWNYICYLHSFSGKDHVYGTNSAIWEAYGDHIGGRTNVWYTNPVELANYRYMTDVQSPVMTESATTSNTLVSVDGGSLNRAKFGLGTPVTYKISKPSGWDESTDYGVYYRDTGAWYTLPERLASEVFTGENCYRDITGYALVSQGLPEWSESFDVLLSTEPPSPLGGSGVGLLYILKLNP
jgi:hypothetical protein